MESERLRRIREENAKFEQESPYNFCDRWCERCAAERQNRCRLYLDEFERKVSCIAHGKEPDDPEITSELLQQQYAAADEALEELAEESGIDFDELDEETQEAIRRQEEFVENNPLHKTVEQYHKKGVNANFS